MLLYSVRYRQVMLQLWRQLLYLSLVIQNSLIRDDDVQVLQYQTTQLNTVEPI